MLYEGESLDEQINNLLDDLEKFYETELDIDLKKFKETTEEIKKIKCVPHEMSSTPVLSNGLPDNALDIVKEALDIIHKEDEQRPQIIRQYDDMLARERLVKMLKDDGLY